MTQGEKFKNAMNGPEEVTEALARHFRDYDDAPLTITTVEGFSFTVSGFVGSFLGVNGDTEGMMTMAIGGFSLNTLLAIAEGNHKAVMDCVENIIEQDPRQAMGFALTQMMKKAERESGEGGIGDLLSDKMKSGKAPKELGMLAAMMAMMMNDKKKSSRDNDDLEATGTDDPFK